MQFESGRLVSSARFLLGEKISEVSIFPVDLDVSAPRL